jgi:predicted PurR-regulated permease PerM
MIGIVVFLLIFPNLDAYLINPMVYKKRIELNPVVTIGGILIFSSLFGVIGVIISIPILLVLSVAYNVYKDFLKTKVQQFKESF